MVIKENKSNFLIFTNFDLRSNLGCISVLPTKLRFYFYWHNNSQK